MGSQDPAVLPTERLPKVPLQYQFLIHLGPSVLLILMAIARYYKTRPIGFVKTIVLTKFFQVKWIL